jgi:hypothetical protein
MRPPHRRDGGKMMRVTFSPRAEILDPVAVAGLGRAARALARRLLRLTDERLRELRGAAGGDLLIILGETAALPWADGVAYLGRDPAAPRLLMPTLVRPDIASDVFEQVIARRAAALPSPWAVLFSPPQLFSVAHAAAIERDRLRAWLETHP